MPTTAPLYVPGDQSALIICMALAFLALGWSIWHLFVPGTNPNCMSGLGLFALAWTVECTGHMLAANGGQSWTVVVVCSHAAAVIFGIAFVISALGVISFSRNEHRWQRGFMSGIIGASANGWVMAAMLTAAFGGKFHAIQRGLVVPMLAKEAPAPAANAATLASLRGRERDVAYRAAIGHMVGTLVAGLASSGEGQWTETPVADKKLMDRMQPEAAKTLSTPQGPGWTAVGASQRSSFRKDALVRAAGAALAARGAGGARQGGGISLPPNLPVETAEEVLSRMNLPPCDDPVAELERIMREAEEDSAAALPAGATAAAGNPGTPLDAANSAAVDLATTPEGRKSGLEGFTRMGRRGSVTADTLSPLAEMAFRRVTRDATQIERRLTTRTLHSGFETTHFVYVATVPELPGRHLFDHWVAMGEDIVLEVVSWTPSLTNQAFQNDARKLVTSLLAATTEHGLNGDLPPADYTLCMEKARSYADMGNVSSAMDQWRQASTLQPREPEPAVAIALGLEKSADTATALAELTARAPSLEPTPVVRAQLIRLRDLTGDPTAADEAGEMLRDGLRDDAVYSLYLKQLAARRAHHLLHTALYEWADEHATALSKPYIATIQAAAAQTGAEATR